MFTSRYQTTRRILLYCVMIAAMLATSLGGVSTVRADAASNLQTSSYAIVFVSRQIPPNGSAYYNQTGSMPGVQPWSRFQVAAPGKLIVREVNGTLRTLIDGSNPTAASLNLIDVNAPDVSYDATKIVFAGLPSGSYSTSPMNTPGAWRIYMINVDGTGLRQVTFSDRNINLSQFGSVASNFSRYDDTDPVWLPDGRIVFSSTRWPSFGQYGAALTSNLHVVNADGSAMHRITAERNGAERPLIDPLTGKIVYSRWWRNFRLGTDSMASQTAPEGGYIIKDGICALSHQGAECQEAGGLTALERNAWHLATINPDGTGLAQFAGRSNTFVVGELINHAYGGSFAANGDLYANFFPMTNGTEAAGFGGIRLYKRGANGYTPIIGITTRDEEVQQFVRTNPNSYGVYVGNYAGEPEVMPNGQLVISWAQDVKQDYGLYTINANGGNRTLLYDNLGTTELRARLIRTRPVPPIIADKVTRVASLLPPTAQGPYDIDGTFTFNALNVYFNAPVDVDIASAPPVGSANTIRFFIDHQRNQQRGSFETLDWPILLQEVVVNPNGSVAASAPANVPLFEQLRSAQPGYKIPLTGRAFSPNETSGVAHVAGMNYGRTGDVASCVGCHAGHTLIPVPSAADALWTNLAPGATVSYSSLSSSLSNGDGLVDRRVNLLRDYDNHKRFWQSRSGQNPNQQWVQLAFPVPITIRTVRLYNIPASDSSIQVQQATVRLYSDAAGTVEVANMQSGPLSSNGTNVSFPEVYAKVVRIEFNSVNGSAAGLAEVEVIARAEASDAVPGATATAGPSETPTTTPTGGVSPTATSVSVDAFTKSLLHADGADASTIFTDQTSKVWTANGNAQIDTAQSKFGGASSLFDGSGDYIDTPDHADFDVSNGDFTIDFWMKPLAINQNSYVLAQSAPNGADTSLSWFVGLNTDESIRAGIVAGSTYYTATTAANTYAANTWYHIALVRVGNNLTLYVNGASAGTVSVSGVTANNSAFKLAIGKLGEYNGFYYNGWIDEFRFSNGIARWTSNFTPPNSPYGSGPASTNTPVPTSSLTSTPTLSSTMTATQVAGNTPASPTSTVSSSSPTATSVSVDVSTKALLLMNGSDASTNFTDQSGKIWSANGNAQIDTVQSKFGGASGLFDGSGDYVEIADHADFDVSNGDFTIDFWMKPLAINQNSYVLGQAALNGADTSLSWFVGLNTDESIRAGFVSGSTYYTATTAAGVYAANTWYHVALVRSGNTMTLYVNGVASGNVSVSTLAANNSAYKLAIGRLGEYNGLYYNGWLDEVRFSKGIARWTSNFTPPTSSYGSGPASTNTPVATSSPTSTLVASNTLTATQIPSNTPVSSPTSEFTPTNTSVPTFTNTPTNTATPTFTSSPTNTATVTPSKTPLPTNTPLPTSTKTSSPSGNPSPTMLDTFNRANGRPGSNWGGANSGYRIVSNQLDVRNGGAILWKANSFGKDQEVFVTLTKVDTAGKELDLLLKAQSPTDWGEGVIEVLYDAVGKRVQIWTYTSAQDWVQCGADIPVTFADGDKFGARAKSNGLVEVIRNGALIGSCNTSGWAYTASGGYIGLWFIDAGGAVVDDFGGGTIAP